MLSTPRPAPHPCQYAVEAWNLLGGQIDWQAIPIVFEMLGVDDAERFIRMLFVIRDHMERVRNA